MTVFVTVNGKSKQAREMGAMCSITRITTLICRPGMLRECHALQPQAVQGMPGSPGIQCSDAQLMHTTHPTCC
jgi:hypothetical protein